MSRTGTLDTNSVPKDKIPAFMRLVEGLREKLGSYEATAREVGINSGHLAAIRLGRQGLSSTYARKILAAHKRLKGTA